ncbi:MAG: phytanoyl-CoA dioxygenase family protein [Candidatus Rhabdochlamydia sp.]
MINSLRILIVLLFLFSNLGAIEIRGFLTREDIALFYKQGYLLKKQCLSLEEMNRLNEDITLFIDRTLTEIKKSDDLSPSDQDQVLNINGSRIVFKRFPNQAISIARINGVSGIQPSLLDIVRSEKMIHTFFELLNTSDLEHLISQVHPKMSGDGIAYPKHRDIQFRQSFDPDWQDILGNGSYAICIIPIDRMTQENGGLWIDRNNYPEPQGLEEDLVWITTEPGDFFFMHPYLFHGSGPNLSSMNRKTLLTGFCAFGANHKAYPGSDANTRLTLIKDGSIATQLSPWSQIICD